MSMKKSVVILKRMGAIATAMTLTFLFTSCEKEVFDPTLTHEFAIQSTDNGATYHIKVALPANYNPGVAKYASIYGFPQSLHLGLFSPGTGFYPTVDNL